MANEFKIKNGLILDGISNTYQQHVLTFNSASNTVSYYTSSAFGVFPFTGNGVISGSLIITGSGITIISGNIITPSITGSLFGTSSWAQNVVSASYITSSGVFGPYGSNSILSASYALTASFALNASSVFPFTGNAVITGSLNVSGTYGLNTSNATLNDSTTAVSIDWETRELKDNGTVISVAWNDRALYDATGTVVSIDWSNRSLSDQYNNPALVYSDTGSNNGVRLYGTASFALTASYALSSPGGTGDTTAIEAQLWFLL